MTDMQTTRERPGTGPAPAPDEAWKVLRKTRRVFQADYLRGGRLLAQVTVAKGGTHLEWQAAGGGFGCVMQSLFAVQRRDLVANGDAFLPSECDRIQWTTAAGRRRTFEVTRWSPALPGGITAPGPGGSVLDVAAIDISGWDQPASPAPR
jgi:hypothetical protein